MDAMPNKFTRVSFCFERVTQVASVASHRRNNKNANLREIPFLKANWKLHPLV